MGTAVRGLVRLDAVSMAACDVLSRVDTSGQPTCTSVSVVRDEETANTTIWSSRVMRPDGKRDGDRGSRQRPDAAVPGFRKPCRHDRVRRG
jgi:hypothetical protein